VVIGTDCTGSCKSNYHTNTTTTTPHYHFDIFLSSNFSNCTYVKLTQRLIYLRYLYVYLSTSFSLPWNSIHSDGFRTFPVHKVSAPDGMLRQLTILSPIVASCSDLDAQHLWASNHVSPSLKKSFVLQNNELICSFSICILNLDI